MKYKLITFGCQMNVSDSERIASLLEKFGYQKAQRELEADLIVVNMCSVRQSAVDRIYGLAKNFIKLKTQNPNLKTLLTGCIPKKELKKFENHFDYILSIKTLSLWPNFLKKENFIFYPDHRDEKFTKEFGSNYLKIVPDFKKKFSVFIPISIGCNNFCSFCIVPFVRGPLICRPFEEILEEAKEAIKNGAKEIWLLGQNVNAYSFKTQNSKFVNFAKLLKMVNEIEGDFWIRFTSPHPKNFSDELIKAMAKCEKVSPYLNLPIQSGDDEILKKMKRNYTVCEYRNLVKKIRLAFKKYRKGLEKEIAISTDVIVGFPGENEKHFKNTLKLFKQIKFDMAYIAQYSPRPQTAAEKLKDNVPTKEKKKRWKILTNVLKEIALKKNRKFLGKEILVLPEKEKNGFLIGKSRHYKTVKFKGGKNFIGKFVKVKITKIFAFGLKGELISKTI